MTRVGVTDTALNETATPSTPTDLTEVEQIGGVRSTVPAEPDPVPPRRHEALFIALAVLVGFAVRVIFAIGDHIVSTDESTYLTSGINFWAGHGFTTLSGGAELHFPPGLPFLLGGINQLIGGDPHTATVVVNLVTTTLLILPIAGIASLIAGRRAAVLAAWIAALCPAITWLPLSAGGSAGLFTLLALTALWLALRAGSWSLKPAVFGAAGAGVLVGFAYLTRPEGLFYSVVLIPVLAVSALGGWRGMRQARAPAWRRAGYLVAAFTIPVILLVMPYASYLQSHTGSWELSAKSNASSIEGWRAIAKGDRAAALADQFTLEGDSYRFPPSRTISDVVAEDPAGYVSIVGSNLTQLYVALFNASPIPYPKWQLLPSALLLVAGFAVWRRRHDRATLAAVGMIAIPVVTAISYFVLPRYLIPSIALTCALVAVGLLELPRRWVKVAIVVAFVLLVSSTAAGLYGNADGWFHPTYVSREHEDVGQWIGRHSEQHDLVMSTSQVVGYYAHRDIVPIPYAGQRRVIDFGRHYGVRYLVVDQVHAAQFRPQLRSLLYKNQWKTLRAVHQVRENGRKAVVYEFVPRPPRFHGKVPLLDHIGEAA